VLVEHLLQVAFTLPWLVRGRRLLRRAPARALAWVLVSGAIGSSLGTVCYTAALGAGANPTAAAVLLNLQPVVSTVAGALLFSERIARRFYPWAALAVVAGAVLALPSLRPTEMALGAGLAGRGLLLVGGTILCWGFATAAGRGAMRELPLEVAAPLRLWAGLATTLLVIAGRALATHQGVALAPFFQAAALGHLLALTTVTGALPLFVYFAGLRTTPASLAGYCEMFYTVSATLVGWALLGGTLLPHQAAAAAALVFAIVQLNRIPRPQAAPAAERARAA
jgi:drug/metabolite transporter (DMT)-like permease